MKIRSLLVLLAVSIGIIGCNSSAPTNGSVNDIAGDLNKKAAGTQDAPDSATAPKDADAPKAALGPKGIGGQH